MKIEYFLKCTCLFLSIFYQIQAEFSPNRTDYDAYGAKIALNDNFLVLARNDKDLVDFFIQLAPYNETSTSSQCSIPFPDPMHHFVYTVTLGKKQTKEQFHFYFAGELINGKNGLFVGMVILNRTNLVLGRSHNNNTNRSLICKDSFRYEIEYLSNYGHQEYYILAAEPHGRWVYGLSNEFVFIYNGQNRESIRIWSGQSIWLDATFIPNAIDICDTFGVVTGFIFSGNRTTVKYRPMIFLMNFEPVTLRPTIVDHYKPIPTPATWQDLLTNEDANKYSAKYDMSVSINEKGFVLVGMQFINRVFLLSVNLVKPILLNFLSRHTNGRSIGNGKSISWLKGGIAAMLVNVYSLEYHWISSQLHVYAIEQNGYNSNSTPLSVFPNNHQVLPSIMDPIFVQITSSSSSLALLDSHGQILILNSAPAGFYLVIDESTSMPLRSSSRLCLPGMYKNQSGVHDCTLCPSGTKNPGNYSTECLKCSPNSFCPLGSVHEVPSSALETVIQARPYPKSPESVLFDEILIQNMFSIGAGRCLYVSPLFWTLVAATFAVFVVTLMGLMKYFIKDPRGRQCRSRLKCFFRHTDLIGQGELWVGGLASFSVVVLVTFAGVFSQYYVKQYPIETVSDSYFACDLSMRNAKFQTSVQSLAIPLSSADQQMFDLLDNQNFLLNVNFVNTQIKCDAVSIEALFGLVWSTIRWLDCENINSTLFLSIPLPYQHISVQIYVADPKTIGGLRLGLFGPENVKDRYSLRELNFFQSFHKNDHILARNLPITLSLTKVINETLPIDRGDSIFSGLYIATFTVDQNSVFYNADQFVRSTLTLTTLALTISETPYYVKNLQQPIAKPSEIVFQNLLFITVCLELFGLLFLSYKLVFKPFYCSFLKRNHQLKRSTPTEKKVPENYYIVEEKHPSGQITLDMDYVSYF